MIVITLKDIIFILMLFIIFAIALCGAVNDRIFKKKKNNEKKSEDK